jgi:ABC-2 type transport system ATP-binding protein
MNRAASRPRGHSDERVPLDVRGVTKRFRRRRLSRPRGRALLRAASYRTAVDSVSFRVRPREIYGVIGANGSGKSTLIRVLSTLLIPDTGDVFVFGRDALRAPLSVRPLMNRVSADPSFFRPMSAMENLLFFGRAYGLSGADTRRRSAELLERLDLDRSHAREPMLHLSRGQQQKVALARAFLTSPRLLLLDEPTAGLDPRSKRTVQSFVEEVRDEGVSVLLTTHDMEEAELLCDRIAFIAGGRIVAEGTPLEMRAEVAGTGRSAEDFDMEDVFMALTGRSIEDDEEETPQASPSRTGVGAGERGET